MTKHKIVAFMQNPWFIEGTPQRTIDKYTSDGDFHRRVLAGCMSGKRLLQAFGADLYNKIWWDNANPLPAWTPAGCNTADWQHISRVLMWHAPQLILTFGRIPSEALKSMRDALQFDTLLWDCHHPNARHKTQQDLNDFAERVKRWWDHKGGLVLPC